MIPVQIPTHIQTKAVRSIRFPHKTHFPFLFPSSSSSSSPSHNFVAFSRRSSPPSNIWTSRKTDLTFKKHSQNYVQQHIRNITMSSAATIYEFEPLNSKLFFCIISHRITSHHITSHRTTFHSSHSSHSSHPILAYNRPLMFAHAQLQNHHTNHPFSHRKRRTNTPLRIQRQSPLNRQHRFQMRFHASI